MADALIAAVARLRHAKLVHKDPELEAFKPDNIKEAIQGYIAALEDDGLPVPAEPFETVVVVV